MSNPSDTPTTADLILLFPASDPRCGELAGAIMDTIRERGGGLPFVAVLGTLRLCEHMLTRNQMAEKGLL